MKNAKSPSFEPTVGGLFSGVGGIELGFQEAGFRTIWSNEMDGAATKTFTENFHHEHIQLDVHKLKAKDLEPVDVLVGGFPCQAFSIAGHRKGFSDDRGNLFFEITRLIQEQERAHGFKPKALLLENVKNFYTHDKGNTFKVVLKHLNELGYFVFHGVLNTSEMTRVPQNRERIFMACFREGEGQSPIMVARGKDIGQGLLPVATGITDDMPMAKKFISSLPLSTAGQRGRVRDFLEAGKVDEKYYYRQDRYMYQDLLDTVKSEGTVYQWRRLYVRENKSNVCPTLTANMGTGGHNVPLIKDQWGIRKLTPRECFNLQGFPESFVLPSGLANGQLYKQAGNSVTVTLIERVARLMKVAMEAGG
jgi:DNA (cytosine-5)-methyltransferase 1